MPSCQRLFSRWWVITLMLCSYGFFKELRPSEPYLTESLTKYNNITKEQAYQEVYPVWTYAYLALLVVVFLVTDLLRYKPVIVFEAAGYISTWCLLIWGTGVQQMQLMEFLYGIATSTEVAYITYIYARVEERYYQRVTGCVRAALLLGRFGSGLLSQSLVSSGALTFYQLNYISLSSVTVAAVIALCLPAVRHSVYFHRRRADPGPPGSRPGSQTGTGERARAGEETGAAEETRKGPAKTRLEAGPAQEPEAGSGLESETGAGPEVRPRSASGSGLGSGSGSGSGSLRTAGRLLLADFKTAYSEPAVLQWSVWWAFATCGNLQVGNYIQSLWEEIAPWEDFDTEGALYNGLVEASNTLLGALSVVALGHLPLNWSFLGEPVLAVFSCISGALLVTMAVTRHIAVAYITYVLFRIIYQMLITICSFQVAKTISSDRGGCYGLVFGINTFVALALETILTLVAVNKGGFELAPRPQFQVYGGYFLDLGLLFVILTGVTVRRRGWRAWCSQPVWLARDQHAG